MDEAMKSLRQEYVTEFYIKELEKQMGYWFVKNGGRRWKRWSGIF